MLLAPEDEIGPAHLREDPAQLGRGGDVVVSRLGPVGVDFLHHFQPRALASCRKCRALTEGAPSRPCGQERLHDLLLQEADDGPLRTDLLAALRRGARIAIRITGPAKDLTRSHSRIDRMTEEAGPAAEALAAGGLSITLARVEDADRQYLVVLRPTAAPTSRAGGMPRPGHSPALFRLHRASRGTTPSSGRTANASLRPCWTCQGSIGGKEGSKLELREKAGPNRLECPGCEQVLRPGRPVSGGQTGVFGMRVIPSSVMRRMSSSSSPEQSG
ncbi:hypothetical protein AB0A71_30515 [Kitasatospora aureofaciens]|uniref:hypothetical protein n=1 Tax=Kitasatospora aureofaciens TaxID=1894 RepID=UPI0034047488